MDHNAAIACASDGDGPRNGGTESQYVSRTGLPYTLERTEISDLRLAGSLQLFRVLFRCENIRLLNA